jgi:hypothetical protein
MYRSCYWERNARGPDGVPRPEIEHGGGIFLIFRDGHNLNNFWNHIKQATERGELGHYSAFSPDEGLICVHHSDAWDEYEKWNVGEKIEQILGIAWDVRYVTQQEAHHVSDDEFSEGEEEFYEEEYFDDQ